MRLLFITNFYPPFISQGYDPLCHKTAKYLQSKKHEVQILTGKFGVSPSTPSNLRQPLRVLRYVNYAQANSFDRYMVDRYNYKATAKAINKFKPDLVMFWDLTGISIAPVLAVQNLKQPHLFYISDFWADSYILVGKTAKLKRFLKRTLPNTVGGKLDLCPNIVPTRDLQQHLAKYFHRGNSYLLPFRNEFPSLQYKELSNSEPASPVTQSDKIQLMLLGDLTVDTGLELLFEALEKLQNKHKFFDYTVNLYGQIETAYLLKLKQKLQNLDLEEQVFIKSIPENPEQAFQENQVYLLPHIAHPRVLQQAVNAQATGMPVICADQHGSNEYVKHNETGLIFSEQNTEQLASHILELAKDRSKLTKFSLQSINEAKKANDSKLNFTKLEEIIIKELMGQNA